MDFKVIDTSVEITIRREGAFTLVDQDFFLKVPRPGGEPGIFLVFVYFLSLSALDHWATTPPFGRPRFIEQIHRDMSTHLQYLPSTHTCTST